MMVRFLTQDDVVQLQQVNDLFKQAAKGECLLLLEHIVLVETIWVLQSAYNHNKGKIADGLLRLISKPGIRCDNLPMLQQALHFYQNPALDIVDCILAARAIAEGDRVATFDKGLQKLVSKHAQ